MYPVKFLNIWAKPFFSCCNEYLNTCMQIQIYDRIMRRWSCDNHIHSRTLQIPLNINFLVSLLVKTFQKIYSSIAPISKKCWIGTGTWEWSLCKSFFCPVVLSPCYAVRKIATKRSKSTCIIYRWGCLYGKLSLRGKNANTSFCGNFYVLTYVYSHTLSDQRPAIN